MKGEYDPLAWQREPKGFIPPDAEASPVPDKAAKNLVKWVVDLGPDSILDVGCCDGRYFEWINSSDRIMNTFGSSDYVGLDITPAFLERARERNPEIKFVQGDVRDLPFEDGEFDMVICPNVLMHLPEILKPMQELCRVARNYVIVSLYGSDEEWGHRSNHDHNFLNHWYTWDEILLTIPPEFEILHTWETKPEWDMGMRIHQFVLKRIE